MSRDVRAISKLEVPLIVRVSQRSMKLQEILALGVGSIIELPKAADADLDLLVNNRPIGGGAAVKVGENFGLRIEWIGEPSERVRALGPPSDDHDDEDRVALSLLSRHS